MRTQIDVGIFKSYDIRGTYPDQLNEEVAGLIGRAFVQHVGASRVAVGRDMRASSQPLYDAFARGATEQGADVVDLGLTTTDELYFAVGEFGYPAGAMITASHNPKEYNGLKLCREGAIPLSAETGVYAIRDLVAMARFDAPARHGTIGKRDVLPAFVDHCLSFIDRTAMRPLKVAIDCGNGMGGLIVPAIFKHLPVEVIPLYFELDGNFPNHPASPIEPENMVDLQKKVRETGADLGAAFDGDADRMFPVDEHGNLVDGSMVTAAVSNSLLHKYPGSTILYNLIISKSVPELINKLGGKAVRTRVGHSYIKAEMRQLNEIFGGEHSGHFYFRDNWYADSGLIAFLIILEIVSVEGKPFSELLKPLDKGVRSGEINSKVSDVEGKLKALEEKYSKGAPSVDH